MTRREAREQALAMIFEMNFNDNTVGEMVDNALIFRDETVDEYAVGIAEQVRLHWEDNLSSIEQYSKKWTANRLPKVSLAILMVAMTEIAYVKDAPVGAVINEAVELAKKYNVELEVLSSLNPIPGTVVKEVSKDMEGMLIKGVAKDTDVAVITILNVPDEPGTSFKIFGLLAQKNINVDIILQSTGRDGKKDISFT